MSETISDKRFILTLEPHRTNEMVASTMLETVELARRARSVDIVIRKDGQETRFEAGWLKCLDISMELAPHHSNPRAQQ